MHCINNLKSVLLFSKLANDSETDNTKSNNYHENYNIETLNSYLHQDLINDSEEESFLEWFRGLTDGEGCFEIIHQIFKILFFNLKDIFIRFHS